jgi:hypothetical protein
MKHVQLKHDMFMTRGVQEGKLAPAPPPPNQSSVRNCRTERRDVVFIIPKTFVLHKETYFLFPCDSFPSLSLSLFPYQNSIAFSLHSNSHTYAHCKKEHSERVLEIKYTI